LDVTNSYAIPFEEDLKDPNIWFLDHTYHENMFSMFRKVNAKEKFLGWYTTSPKKNDIEIHQIFKNYCENAVLVVVDPEHSDPLALPTEAFVEM
jgi:26S proteasome regulatory subunit N8